MLRLFPFDRGVVDLLRRAPLRLRREHGLVERGRRRGEFIESRAASQSRDRPSDA